MAATKGSTLRVNACATSGGTYNQVAGITSATMDFDGTNVDVSTLTDADIVRLQAMRDTKITLSGNYESDSTGQALIRAARNSDADLFMQFLPDGSTGFQAKYKCSKYSITGQVGDKLAVSIELEGASALTSI